MKINYSTTRWLLAAVLVIGVSPANAGYVVSHSQEQTISVGMDKGQVRKAIGSPTSVSGYHTNSLHGDTWTYYQAGSRSKLLTFQVDFSADGKVIATNPVQNNDVGA